MDFNEIKSRLERIDRIYAEEMGELDRRRQRATMMYNAERSHLTLQLFSLMKQEKAQNLLNAKEAADLLKVSVATVRKNVAEGLLPYVKVGKALRFSVTELEKYQRGEWKSEAERIADAYIAKSLRLR